MSTTSSLARFSLVFVSAMLSVACATQPAPVEPASLSGLELYQQLCASCHGVNGYGDGLVAPLIEVQTPDLTRIAARAGGEFPTDQVRWIIDGREDRRAHGSRDMPVWGWQFYDNRNVNDTEARARSDELVERLVAYLRSIQRS
jgi:mono/diheme cytochrome c family protein